MSTDNTVPQLFAFLPDGGAKVGVSDDHTSVAVFVDLDTHHEDLHGTHFIDLSLAEAVNLSTALLGAISKIVDHQETQRIAEQYWKHNRARSAATTLEQLEAEQ